MKKIVRTEPVYLRFAAALLLSLLLHLLFPLGANIAPYTAKPRETQPLTVEMRAFSLDSAPPSAAAPAAESAAPRSAQTPPKITAPPAPAVVDENINEKENAGKMENIGEAETASTGTQTLPEQNTAEPLHLPDGSLNAASAEVWEKIAQAQTLPETAPAGDLPFSAQNLDAPAENPQPAEPFQAERFYDVITAQGMPPAFPHEAQLRYEGPLGITGTMDFSRTADSYRIQAAFNIPFNKMTFVSEGKIADGQLMPLRYTDTRKGRIYAAAEFDYANALIRYGRGGAFDETAPVQGMAHDFFSWAWQISIDGKVRPGITQITSGKRVYLQEVPAGQEVAWRESYHDTGEGMLRIVSYEIARSSGDKQDSADYGFAPDFANVPAQIIFRSGSKNYEMNIIGIRLDGRDYFQALRSMRDTR